MPMNTSPPAVVSDPLSHDASGWWNAVFVKRCLHTILFVDMSIAVNAPVVIPLPLGNDSSTPMNGLPPSEPDTVPTAL